MHANLKEIIAFTSEPIEVRAKLVNQIRQDTDRKELLERAKRSLEEEKSDGIVNTIGKTVVKKKVPLFFGIP